MDRLEVKFSSVVQRGQKGTDVTVRLYRLNDPVVTADGTTYPRVLLRTLSVTLGPIYPWRRLVELLTAKAAEQGYPLPEIVCDL